MHAGVPQIMYHMDFPSQRLFYWSIIISHQVEAAGPTSQISFKQQARGTGGSEVACSLISN